MSGIVFEPFNEVRKRERKERGAKRKNACRRRPRHLRSTHAPSLTPPFFLLLQVKPELAVVAKADGTTGSLARSGYTAACEAAVNEQIK